MSSFFKRGKKSPPDLIRSTKKHIDILLTELKNEEGKTDKTEAKSEKIKKAMDKITANLSDMKFMLYGDGDNDPKQENVKKLADELFGSDLLLIILQQMKNFDFEARKDVAQIYNFVLRQRKKEALEYVNSHPEILKTLVLGYKESEIALNCGSILREVIRIDQLCEMLLNSPLFDFFFEYVSLPTFDVASDAFATFKLMLTKHKVLCAKFLEKNFDEIFKKYNELLQSKNYVTKRQSLKLLGELLLNRANFNVMIKYINAPQNLKVMMNLLRGNTKAIQFEAFHVFKIFVANPKKAKPIVDILVRNRDKLIEFLKKFQKDKEDEQFNDEKAILLATLEQLDDSVLKETEKEKKT